MAAQSDVENTLASMASAVLYPNGTAQPSIAGATITVARGWPEPGGKQLDAILAAGNAMITVFPMAGMGANTTRFPAMMQPVTSIPAAQLILSVSGNQVTVGGAINAGEAACVNANYKACSYGVLVSDTTATVAASLAAKIPGATASGSVITITGAFEITATVSVPVLMQAEEARETRVFMVTIWCPNPTLRDIIVKAIDVAFKQQLNKRILLPDNTLARMIYRGTFEDDRLAKQNIYRTDLRYEVEWVTTSTETDSTVTNFAVSTTPIAGATFTVNI